jgi:hypothetical protein
LIAIAFAWVADTNGVLARFGELIKVGLGGILSFLLFYISKPINLKENAFFLQIFDQHIGNVLNCVLVLVLKDRRTILAHNRGSAVSLLVKVEGVFYKDISAEIFRQIGSFFDLNQEINSVINQIFGFIGNYLLWWLFCASRIARHNINLKLTLNFVGRPNEVHHSWVVDQVWKRLESVVPFAD